VTTENVSKAIQIAYDSLKRHSFYWDSVVPGYIDARMAEPIKLYSRTKGAEVIERDGFQLVSRVDGQLVPRFGGAKGFDNVYDDEKGARLIARAATGDQVAHGVLCFVAARFVESGCSFPPNLREYIAGALLSQSKEPPQRRRGRDPYANYSRDRDVARVVKEIMNLGFRPTRNRATESESACSIVSRALNELATELNLDIGLSDVAIEKIWQRLASDLRQVGSEAKPLYLCRMT